VTGHEDDSLWFLSKMYGVSGDAISRATFGGVGATLIYPWLRDNGGTRQARAPEVPTGYHWSFSPGMVVNIPDPVDESQSPVSNFADPPAFPGGPSVTVLYVDAPIVGESGAPSTGREPWADDPSDAVAEVEPDLVDPSTGEPVAPPPVKHAAIGVGWGTWIILGLVAWAILGGPSKPTKKRRKRRKPAKRRRRRRR
jgi:hypothetical protein